MLPRSRLMPATCRGCRSRPRSSRMDSMKPESKQVERLIDPPSTSAPPTHWQRFLTELQKDNQSDPQIQRYVAWSKSVLTAKQEGKTPPEMPLSKDPIGVPKMDSILQRLRVPMTKQKYRIENKPK